MASLDKFGLEIKRPSEEKARNQVVTFTTPDAEDGSSYVNFGGGRYGQYLDISGVQTASFKDLVHKYRAVANVPECDQAIDEILNEVIVNDEDGPSVVIILDDVEHSDGIKKKITEEFENLLSILDFQTTGYDIFKKWYIDSLLVFHKVIDESKKKDGILELVPIDPTKIQKIKEIEEVYNAETQTILYKIKDEYYVYSNEERGSSNTLRLSKDIITYVPSGLYDHTNKRVLGYLYKALKPANQLSMMEDSLVVYRYTRAPERRVFYIDVGNLPKGKAEEYVRGIMNRYRNKITYDVTTGQIQDSKKHMAILEDFWLPRREGGRGTEITTLPGGENLGSIDDIVYFQKKLYRSLNVPLNRLEQEAQFALGRANEVTREEVKFSRFIDRLRTKFTVLFFDLLKTQLELKGIISSEDWEEIKENIRFDFQEDNHFTELKQTEIMVERFNLLGTADAYAGKYFSRDFIRRDILRQTDEEIKEQDKLMEKEAKKYGPFDGGAGGGFGGGGDQFGNSGGMGSGFGDTGFGQQQAPGGDFGAQQPPAAGNQEFPPNEKEESRKKKPASKKAEILAGAMVY